MRFRSLTLALVLATLLLPLPVLAGAGWEVEFRATETGDDKAESGVLRMDDDHVRVIPAEEDGEILMDPEGFTLVSHEDKAIYRLTFTQMEALMAGMSQMMDTMKDTREKMLEEARKSMTEEEVAELEAKLDAEMETEEEGPEFTYDKQGDTETIAGLKADHYVVKEDGEKIADLWVTNEIPIEMIRGAVTRVIDIMPPALREKAEMVHAGVALPGFPLKVIHEEGTLEAVRAERGDFGADAWATPDYESKPLPFMGGGMGGR